MLMHGSLTASSRILGAPALTGGTLLTFDLAWAAVMGIVVWAVIVASERLRGQPVREPAPSHGDSRTGTTMKPAGSS
jgi:hypothetical protein